MNDIQSSQTSDAIDVSGTTVFCEDLVAKAKNCAAIIAITIGLSLTVWLSPAHKDTIAFVFGIVAIIFSSAANLIICYSTIKSFMVGPRKVILSQAGLYDSNIGETEIPWTIVKSISPLSTSFTTRRKYPLAVILKLKEGTSRNLNLNGRAMRFLLTGNELWIAFNKMNIDGQQAYLENFFRTVEAYYRTYGGKPS